MGVFKGGIQNFEELAQPRTDVASVFLCPFRYEVVENVAGLKDAGMVCE
jgi:hypothetical protein